MNFILINIIEKKQGLKPKPCCLTSFWVYSISQPNNMYKCKLILQHFGTGSTTFVNKLGLCENSILFACQIIITCIPHLDISNRVNLRISEEKISGK